MEDTTTEVRIIKTHFSRRPHPNSLLVTSTMLFICVMMSQLVWANPTLGDYLVASLDPALSNLELWRLLTTVFIHGDWLHLISNSYMLGILGYFVYGYFGFSIYPLLSLLMAMLINALALATYPAHVKLVGASGLVYFLAGFWLMMFIFIERQHHLTGRLLRATGVGLMILFPTSFDPQVSYRTHVIGLVVGIAFAMILFNLRREYFRGKEETMPQLGE